VIYRLKSKEIFTLFNRRSGVVAEKRELWGCKVGEMNQIHIKVNEKEGTQKDGNGGD